MEVLVFPLIMGIAAVVIAAAVAGSRRSEQKWKAAAERLDLAFRPGGLISRPKLAGRWGDLDVTVDVSSSSAGSSGSVRTRYRVRYPSLGLGLRITRRTGFSKMASALGAADVSLGDPAFDDAFTIRTDQPERLGTLLTPQARATLVDLVRDLRTLKISDEAVSYEKSGIERETDVLVEVVHRLTEAARLLQGTAAPRRPAPAPPAPRPVPPVRPADPFGISPIPEAPPAPRPPAQIPAAPPAADSGIPAEAVAADLFGTRRLSFEISRRFAEAYRGETVGWSGTVTTALDEIGLGHPVKLVVAVASVRHQLFGVVAMEIEAVVSSRRAPAPGDRVQITGTLAEVDPMMRRLIVEDARLT